MADISRHFVAIFVVFVKPEARRFCKSLLRLTHLNNLCQAGRGVVQNPDITSQMLADWSRVDLTQICKQILYTFDSYNEHDYSIIVTRQFISLDLCVSFLNVVTRMKYSDLKTSRSRRSINWLQLNCHSRRTLKLN